MASYFFLCLLRYPTRSHFFALHPATPILGLSKLLPPASNGFNGKCRVIVDTNVHPPLVRSQVIDAIGNRFTLGFVRKIMRFNRNRFAFWLPFLCPIFELTQVLLLFGINRDHRTVLPLKHFDLSSNVVKLTISVWVLLAFLGFAVALLACNPSLPTVCTLSWNKCYNGGATSN